MPWLNKCGHKTVTFIKSVLRLNVRHVENRHKFELAKEVRSAKERESETDYHAITSFHSLTKYTRIQATDNNPTCEFDKIQTVRN